ncbi:MAG: Ig-like domain-containing protein [Bacteroidota bacterium]
MRFGIVLILFLLSACAQVGILGGGPKDEDAPKPVLEKMSPKNGATSYHGKELVIPFDEFIKLNNPSENIIVVPPNIKPFAKIKKKSLVITWDEELAPNTTYAFYLNRAIQDTKENNDSLMTFVFSTGDYIDSMTAQFYVREAFGNKPQKKWLVGLYENYSDTIRPNYFAESVDDGQADLSYLKPGTYDVVAFLDKNNDLKHQPDEQIGFKSKSVEIMGNYSDSIPIRTYIPKLEPKITNFTFFSPGTFTIASNRSLKNASFSINGDNIPNDNYIYYSSDSLMFPYLPNDSSSFTLITKTNEWSDTTSIRITQREKNKPLKLKVEKSNDILPEAPVRLISSIEVDALNAPMIQVENAKDSSIRTIKNLNSQGSSIELNFDKQDLSEANIIFLPGAVTGKNGANPDTIIVKVNCLSAKDLGNMDVDVSSFEEDLVLEILLGNALIESVPMDKNKRKHSFTNLKPGDYSFRIIFDENQNGRWDGGNRELKIQPEFVEIFPETKKVRAKWDLEVVLKKPDDGE